MLRRSRLAPGDGRFHSHLNSFKAVQEITGAPLRSRGYSGERVGRTSFLSNALFSAVRGTSAYIGTSPAALTCRLSRPWRALPRRLALYYVFMFICLSAHLCEQV
eukprot:4969805-Pleurochrysis_carterae.AAC.2